MNIESQPSRTVARRIERVAGLPSRREFDEKSRGLSGGALHKIDLFRGSRQGA